MRKDKGLTLVEAVVGVAIVSGFLLTLAGVFQLYFKVILGSAQTVKAGYLAEEAVEAVKYLRRVSWDESIAPLAIDTPYYLSIVDGEWTTDTPVAYIDNRFDRSFSLGAVYRDAASNITESGGTLDINTKKLVVTVSWSQNGATTTKSLTAYIMNLYDN